MSVATSGVFVISRLPHIAALMRVTCCELICLAHKRNFAQRPAANWHDGQITSDFPKLCQASEPIRIKNILLSFSPKSVS
jgi:hypothetical protein